MPENNFVILATPSPVSHRTAEENLGLAYLAAALRNKNYDVKIIDGWLEGLSYQEVAQKILGGKKPLFVGFSAYQSNMPLALKTIELVRQEWKDVPFVAGGFGPTFNAQDFLDAGFDVAALAEGEDVLPALAEHYQGKGLPLSEIKNISYKNEKGEIVQNRLSPLSVSLDDLPYPARDTMHMAIERRTPVHVSTARGCTGNCLFCSINAFFRLSKTKKYRSRSIPNIIGELKELDRQGVKHIKIIDDSFIDGERDGAWCAEFADALEKEKLNFLLRGSIRADKVDENVLFHLKRAGFFSFSCGIENFSQSALERMNKGAKLEENLKALDLFKKYHIYVQAGQILFDPETTMQELKENYFYMKKYSWIISKGVFTEMFAAEGTAFTKKVNRKDLLVSDQHRLGNYEYRILDPKVANVHDALKKWHMAHMALYDKAIDPLTSPKALYPNELKIFYDIYKKIRYKDLEVMGKILKNAEKMDRDHLLELVDKENAKNKPFFEQIASRVSEAYEKCNLSYDAAVNPFFVEKSNVR